MGSTLAWVGKPGEALEASQPEEKKEMPKAAEISTPEKAEQGTKSESQTGIISPVVKKVAEDNQVDLDQVHGTGKDGRITKEDILAFIAAKKTTQPAIVEKPEETN